MDELIEIGKFHVASLWRKRWYIVPIAWVLAVPGWIVVMSLPDRWESQARIYVDADTLLSPLLRGISVESNISQQVDHMQRTLLSQPNLEKLIRMADLDLATQSQNQSEALLRSITKRTTIAAQGQGKNLFTISFNDKRPEVAQRVVQSLIAIFVESNLGASRTDLESALRFIDRQVTGYERQLQNAEANLAEFKRANLDFLGTNAGSFAQKLEQLRAQQSETKSTLGETIARRDSLQRDLAITPATLQLDTATPQLYVMGNDVPPSLAAINNRLAEAQRQLDTMLTRYTEQHPDVPRQRRIIDSLRQQVDQETTRLEHTPAPARDRGATTVRKQSMPNPLYDQIKIKMIEAASSVESLQRKLALIEDELARSEKIAAAVPAVEAKLSTLNRDYGMLKNQYDQLIQRREAARLAENVETRADKVQFRVIDPPQVPTTPSGPARLILISGVLLASVGAGLAVAFVASLLDDTFISLDGLRDAVTVPVLGSISFVMNTGERRRRMFGAVSFAASLASLVAAYGYLLLLCSPSSFS